MSTTRGRLGAGWVLAAGCLAATVARAEGFVPAGPPMAPLGLESRGQNFPLELPTPEIPVGGQLQLLS